MVKYSQHATHLDAIFSSLADPTRRSILASITNKPLSVSDIAKPHTLSLPAILKHVQVLEKAKLVRCTKQGRQRMVRINAQELQHAAQYLQRYEQFWKDRLDALEQHLTRR